MTPFHDHAVTVICVAVLTTFAWLAVHALIVTSWRTPPGRLVPSAHEVRAFAHPMRGRRGT